MSYLVTGGAGFIGSNVVTFLNERGIDDIYIVDNIASTLKWKNIVDKRYKEYIHKSQLFERLKGINDIEAVIHMGACSSTTEKNYDYLWLNNVECTKKLWNYCTEKRIPFIYASSAATYGDGSQGFNDECDIDELRPLNGYGYSKQVFDQWVKHQAKDYPAQYVGLKFFNVYGPGEYYKGSMASMAFHGFNQINESGEVRLFKSENPDYPDGGQKRDFVYVRDVCQVIMWFLEHKSINGLYNVGTGKADTFENLVSAVFKSLGIKTNIIYIDMPEELRGKYQYYTQASITKLRNAGCDVAFKDVWQGVDDYVQKYLKCLC